MTLHQIVTDEAPLKFDQETFEMMSLAHFNAQEIANHLTVALSVSSYNEAAALRHVGQAEEYLARLAECMGSIGQAGTVSDQEAGR